MGHPANKQWESYELVGRDDAGRLSEDRRVFTSELLGGRGDRPTAALQKMSLLATHGWPDARLAMKDGKGQPLIDPADSAKPAIWILKAKPSCWRLYFNVDQSAQPPRFIYLYAKCKKRTPRDPRDAGIARTRLAGLGGPRGFGLIAFDLPGR